MPGRVPHAHGRVRPQLPEPRHDDQRTCADQETEQRGLGVQRPERLTTETLRVHRRAQREPDTDDERRAAHARARPAEPLEQRGTPLPQGEHDPQRRPDDHRRDRPGDVHLARARECRRGDGLHGREGGRCEERDRERVEPRRAGEPRRVVQHGDALGGRRVLRGQPPPARARGHGSQSTDHGAEVVEPAARSRPGRVRGEVGVRGRGSGRVRGRGGRARGGEVGVVLA
ncbi:hypothetical protein CPE01_18150 [Cellulomonas persica]|uniref:Uncharacterized protein n=1 Tax=Cellulomonas persica TaxID=76861 RepID=A0A510UTU2_9CELL|nr:hypothetical protein CPE01_18150 [Cellulomonas persica]